MNPDDVFTVSRVKTAIENRGEFDRVLVTKRDGEFIFEAYAADGQDVRDDAEPRLLEMLSSTYGATVDVKSATSGEEYFDIRVSDGGLYDDR